MIVKECFPVLLGFLIYLWNSCVGLSQYIQLGLVLPLAVASFVLQDKISIEHLSNYRCEEDGLWCSLLMLAVSYIVEHEGNVILRIVTLLTLFMYGLNKYPCSDWKRLHYAAVIALTIYGAVTTKIFFRDPINILLIIMCAMIYVQLLYKLPEVFRKCFTFGELTVLLQLYICEVYIVLLYYTGILRMSTLEKLSVVVFIGVHVVITLFYALSRHDCSVIHTWLAVVATAALYACLSLHYNFNIDELLSFIQHIFLNNTSIVLLTWWVLWLMSSILLVCFYGNQKSYKMSSKASCPLSKRSCSGLYEHSSSESKLSKCELPASISEQFLLHNNEPSVSKHAAVSSKDKQFSSKTSPIASDSVPTSSQLDVFPSDGDGAENVPDDEALFKQISADELDSDNEKDLSLLRNIKRAQGSSEIFMLLRKYFHLAIVCVYVPGLMYSPSLLYLASIAAAAVLIILEAIRRMKIKPLSDILDEYLHVFLDDQDQGDLILTPIYLLIGCSLPLWWNIKQINTQCSVSIYSGLLSVGVGDAMASYIGRKYGRHKWPDSKKTIEGTASSFIAQILALLFLQLCCM